MQQTLARSGGYAIIEEDEKIIFINDRTGWLYTFNFVCIIVLVITLVNSIVLLFMNQYLLGVILASLTIISAVSCATGVYMVRKNKKKQLDPRHILAIADLKSREFLDVRGQIIAPLDTVSFQRAFQMFSSSFAINATWPEGSMIVLRGNPFAGGSYQFIHALQDKGLMNR